MKRRPARQGFAVEPFRNVQGIGALQHLTYGVPAVIAERFAQAAPLRFAGRPELFSRTAPAGARWIVRGSFERRADWNVAVTVEIHAAAAPDQVAARATAVGGKDAVPATAVQAAVDAFAAVPGVAFDAATLARVRAPISHDAYAFVLYGRGVGAFHGGGGGPARAELAAGYLRHALLVEPTVPEIRRFLGLALLATGKPQPARGMLTYALDKRPDYLLALRSLAAVDRGEGGAAAPRAVRPARRSWTPRTSAPAAPTASCCYKPTGCPRRNASWRRFWRPRPTTRRRTGSW